MVDDEDIGKITDGIFKNLGDSLRVAFIFGFARMFCQKGFAEQLFRHPSHDDGRGNGSVKRFCRAAFGAGNGDGVGDERQDVWPDAVRFAADDNDAFRFALHFEKVFAVQ